MFPVIYQFRYPYLRRRNGVLFPGLLVELENPLTGARTEMEAELDSGAAYSLFDGQLAVTIGIDLFGGEPFAFRLASGVNLESRIRSIVVCHPDLGDFPMNARFSTAPIPTNLLGRDFFDFVLVGFDEHSSEVYLRRRR